MSADSKRAAFIQAIRDIPDSCAEHMEQLVIAFDGERLIVRFSPSVSLLKD